MKIIVGTIVKKADKILMVQEAKKDCYGKWDFPTGKLEAKEDVFEGAVRETLEETGHKVIVKKMLPVQILSKDDSNIFRFMFLADVIEYNAAPRFEDEILETKFVSIDEIRNMRNELREPKSMLDILDAVESNRVFDLKEIFM